MFSGKVCCLAVLQLASFKRLLWGCAVDSKAVVNDNVSSIASVLIRMLEKMS